MHNIVFENGWFLWFLLVIPLLVAYYIYRQSKAHASMQALHCRFPYERPQDLPPLPEAYTLCPETHQSSPL
ncbi:MAG: hypothetical protein MZV63_07880 [Marinilabiliales bacterium]|nr:hypothetical protein [Marinilabiliales bacterium]